MKMNKCLLFLSILMLGWSKLSLAEPLTILTSIKPLGLIIKAIKTEQDQLDVLLNNNTSPHDYALKPSDIKKINQADLVIWLGKDLEMFMQKAIANQPNKLALLENPNIDLRDYDKDDQSHAHHHHSSIDPHIWLGPLQAKQIAKVVAKALTEKRPENKAAYQAALTQFIAKVDAKVSELKANLALHKQKGFFVFHDAYGYFEKAFDLSALGHLTVNPERKPGAKTLITIRQQLLKNKASCVFSEPQFNPATIKSLTRGTQTKVVLIDPLASDLTLQQHDYIDFLSSLGKSYLACFQ